MVAIVGVAGLAGSGKSTAVRYLAELTGGQVIYLGNAVLEEIRARGLPETRDNEKRVRIELRRLNGPTALAMHYVAKISECVARGVPVFVDAIMVYAEFELLVSCAQGRSAHLLAIEASFDVRRARLKHRPERRFSDDELTERDKMELETLGTGAVMAAASHTVHNRGTLTDFQQELERFVGSCS